MRSRSKPEPLEVVVVGGGVAGLEASMALRALAGQRVRVKLVAPQPDFVYRPMSVAEPFGLGEARRYPLEKIASDLGAELVQDALERVDPEAHGITTRRGEQIGYGALVLAMGATPKPAWEHVTTFAGSSDSDAVRRVVTEVERGEVESVAFVVPSGVAWPLPLYELALMTAERAAGAGRAIELVVYTPESEPLGVFGREASVAVAAALERAGVSVVRAVEAQVTPVGELVVQFEETPLRYERVVALPRLEGPAPGGVPCDRHGFIPIDSHGVVRGVEDIYAAGDGTDFPVKQGGIAAQQADALAEVIAGRAGADIEPRPFRPTLRGKLLTGGEPRFLRADLGEGASEASEASDTPLWWPVAKIAGTYLAPYLAAQEAPDAGSAGRRQPSKSAQEVLVLPGEFENNPWGE